MFTFNGRDAHRSLTASRLHLPIKASVAEILPEREKTDDDDADSALQRLPAPGLRGTWARAYALLTRLVSQIGWDELLKTRSAVFVMEEEYRMQKAHADIAAVSREDTVADDDASTKGVLTPPSENREDSPNSSAAQSPAQTHVGETESVIPTIRISTESAREESLRAEKAAASAKMNGREKANGDPAVEGLQQPAQAAAGDNDGESKDPTSNSGSGGQESFSFSNKRLCERWLDNLFMVLYEVSVVYDHRIAAVCRQSTRTSEFGRFFEQKSRTSKRSMWHTAKPDWNGKSLATLVCGCITRRRQKRRFSGRWTPLGTRSSRG